MLRFLFGNKRLDGVETQQAALRRENSALKARLAHLESALVKRRAEDIVGSRDCLIPVPRPGSSAHRLLTQNRTLRRRAKEAEARSDQAVEAALVEVFAVADVLQHREPALADTVRGRAENLAAKVRAIGDPVESSAELYADHVRSTWSEVDHVQVASDFLVRLAALDVRVRSMPGDLAAIAALTIATLLSSGPVAAADVIRSHGEVTEDLCAVAGEALLYALALALGARWTEDVRTAWSVAIDDVAKALGFLGHGGAIFSMEDSVAISSM